MDLPPSLAWLIDDAGASATPQWFLAELGRRLSNDGMPLTGGALTFAVAHPIIARRTWLWRAQGGVVSESLSFADDPSGRTAQEWLARLGVLHEKATGPTDSGPALVWATSQPLSPSQADLLDQVGRFARAPTAALVARATLSALLEAYLGRRSAARVQAGAFGRGTGETIRAALLCADLRDFTVMSEATEPTAMIAALDAWFDRVAGAVHVFGGEVLKFMGDGVLAIFPATGAASEACDAAMRAVTAIRAGMAHLDAVRQAQGLDLLPFGVALHYGEILWGNVGAADRLDFTAIGPAINLVSRLEGLCKPLGHNVLVSGAVATETTAALTPLGSHILRGIADPCAVFTVRAD